MNQSNKPWTLHGGGEFLLREIAEGAMAQPKEQQPTFVAFSSNARRELSVLLVGNEDADQIIQLLEALTKAHVLRETGGAFGFFNVRPPRQDATIRVRRVALALSNLNERIEEAQEFLEPFLGPRNLAEHRKVSDWDRLREFQRFANDGLVPRLRGWRGLRAGRRSETRRRALGSDIAVVLCLHGVPIVTGKRTLFARVLATILQEEHAAASDDVVFGVTKQAAQDLGYVSKGSPYKLLRAVLRSRDPFWSKEFLSTVFRSAKRHRRTLRAPAKLPARPSY